MEEERRSNPRREFGYYMRVMDSSSSEPIGYLSDICPRGVRIDTPKALMVNKNYSIRLDLTPDVSDRPFITFVINVKWCHPDISAPGSFIEGCEVVTITHHDEKIFNNILEHYGKPEPLW